MRRRILLWGGAIVLATVCSLLSVASMTIPYEALPGSRTVQMALLAFDLPVALLNRLYPEVWRSHFTYFLRCGHTYCFPDEPAIERARYLRAAVPAYLLLFFAPAFLWRRLRGR